MTISDWVMVIAVLVAPILAVQAQSILDSIRATKQRRLHVFRELMRTRAARLSGAHVQALNSIDLEFAGKSKDKRVRGAWKLYFEHLSNGGYGASGEAEWFRKGDELLFDLIHEIATAVGYGFDKAYIQRVHYAPQGHAELEADQAAIRKGVAELLAGSRSIPVIVRDADDDIASAASRGSPKRRRGGRVNE